MRYDDIALDQHQVVDANTGPLTSSLVAASDFCTNLPCSIEEQPDHVPLLHAALAPRDVCAVVEDKREQEVRLLDCFLHDEKVFTKLFPCLCLTQEG